MKQHVRLSHTQIIALGFLLLILAGTALLMLPVSQRPGVQVAASEALFTATSAACVTGLVVRDTWQTWSLFGQVVLLLLIQTGGLGFMTIATRFFLLLHRKVGLREREILSESINNTRIGGILKLTRRIVFITFVVESAGALLLAVRFVPQFGPLGIWFAVFHAVSAFCNAGFDLMGGVSGAYSSFTLYAGDWLVSLTLIALILIGGLGFVVWDDLVISKWKWKRYSLQTRMVLTGTLALVVGGTVLFFFLEQDATGAGCSTGTRILTALFDAVTPRTAGFNTVDTAQLSDAGKLLSMILMFIGGSSGSTAGGIKITTLMVLLLYACAAIRGEKEARCFGRRLPLSLLGKAVSVCIVNVLLVLTGTMMICAMQPAALTDVLFETVSAVSTVGMSTGITRAMEPVSRVILIILMYCGRVGGLSFATALTQRKAPAPVQYPAEEVIIG